MTCFRIVAVGGAVLAAALVLPTLACSTSTVLRRPDRLTATEAMAQTRWLTGALADREVVVELVARSGDQATSAPAVTGRVTPIDRTRFLLSETPARTYRLPFESTRSFSTVDRKKGAMDGMLVGVLLGGVAGAIFGAAASRIGCDQDYDPPHCLAVAPVAVPVGVAGALLGGAVGAGIGALIGHRLSYTF